MRIWVRRVFTAPIFEGDEDKTRIAALLHRLLLVIIMAIITGSIVVALVAPTTFANLSASSASALRLVGVLLLGLFAVALVSFILMVRGLVRLASVLILLGLWISFTILMFLSGGVNSILGVGYLTTTVIAGLLLGRRSAILMVELTMVAALGMLYAEENGVFPAPLLSIGAGAAWINLTGNLIIVGAMLVLASRGSTEVLARARRSAAALDQQREFLEEVVADRTRDLERRAIQLTNAAAIGRAAASILHLDTLTHQVVDLVRERFHLHYAALFLLDNMGKYAVLEAGTGDPGRSMKEQGVKLEVGGESMVGVACAQRQACVAQDVGEAEPEAEIQLVHAGFRSEQASNAAVLPETRSEMALPLVVGGRVLGALDVQSTNPSAFSKGDMAALQLVADHVAVAIENAQKFSREADLLEATSPLFRVSRRLVSAVSTDEIVEAIVTSVGETEADGCVVGRLNRMMSSEVESVTILRDWHRHSDSRFPTGATFPVEASPLPLRMVTSFWTVNDATRSLREDQQASEGLRLFLARYNGRGFVNVPLKVADQVIGFVSVYRTGEGSFSPVSIRLYETLADQAAVALERARLLDEAQARVGRERVVAGVTSRLRETLDVDTVIRTGVDEIARALGLVALDLRLGSEEELAGLGVRGVPDD